MMEASAGAPILAGGAGIGAVRGADAAPSTSCSSSATSPIPTTSTAARWCFMAAVALLVWVKHCFAAADRLVEHVLPPFAGDLYGFTPLSST
ncbi:hypothetical protein M8494_32990 [Serratia ureilytica]